MKQKENYLEKKPVKKAEIVWKTDSDGKVILEIENKGVFNFLAQKILKKPRISYIHLDETGSFIWPVIDGEKDITQIGKEVKEHFGEKAEPLYERLVKYFGILKENNFIDFK